MHQHDSPHQPQPSQPPTRFSLPVTMYIRLAHQEERDALAEFGEAYARYAAVTPGVCAVGSQHSENPIAIRIG
jgi:hypothetical protein